MKTEMKDEALIKTWFTADLHVGHRRAIEYCDRPFADVEEMNRVLIERWNETVAALDTVIILGDFAWKGYEYIFHQLNGIKHLILGNHDKDKFGCDTVRPEIMQLPWASQPLHYYELPLYEDRVMTNVVLCHYSMRRWPSMYKGSVMLYGHSHNKLSGFRVAKGSGGTLDVGVDCWDFRPIDINQIKARIRTLPEWTPDVAI